jgi:hypothetical protein
VVTAKPSHADVSIAEGFALMLETACEHFEILQRLIRQEIRRYVDLILARDFDVAFHGAREQAARHGLDRPRMRSVGTTQADLCCNSAGTAASRTDISPV